LALAGAGSLLAFVPVQAQSASQDASIVPSAGETPAPPAGPTIAVQLGFGGLAKVGGWLPVAVQVSNEGASVSGELQVEVDDSSGTRRNRAFYFRPPTVYTVPATLPSHSRKQYQIDVFLPFPTKGLTVRLMTDQGLLVQQDAPLQALSGSDVLCGVLSRNQDFFQLLKNLDLPGRQGKKPVVVPLRPEDLPARQHTLSSMDCLIVNNISLSGLTDDQKAALLGWVNDGGLLILGGGSGWQKTLQPLPKELLPVDVNGVRSIPSLNSLTNFAHQPIKGNGPWLVSAGKVVSGTVVAQDSGVPLLVGTRRGKGSVIYLALDPTTEPLNTWSGNAALWKYMMAYNSTPLAVYPFFNAYGGFSTIQNWGLPPRTAIYNISGVDPPSSGWLVVFIGIYALIAGPVNYLVLRLTGHKALGWVTIPVFIAAGAVVSYQFVQQYRGSDLVLNKISLVRSEDDSSQVNVRSYVSLYTPRKGDFELLTPGTASVTSYSRPAAVATPTLDSSNSWQLKVNEGDTSNRADLPLEVSNTASVLIDSQTKLAGSIQSDLKVQGDKISGSVTNRTGEPVSDVVLAIGSDVYGMGTLNSGQTKPVDFNFSSNSCSNGPDATKVKALLSGATQGDATRSNRESVLDAFLGSSNRNQPSGLSGLTLIGWLKQSPLPVQVAGLHPSVKETNLYVTNLPMQFQRGVDVAIPSALMETKQIGTFSTNFQRNCQYELNPAGSLAVEYALPVAASDMASNKLVLHMVGRYSGNPRSSRPGQQGESLGQIFLYNWQTSDWDAQGFVWGDNVIKDAAPYLSATSTLRVRYTYKAPANQPTTSIQFTLDLTDEGQLR